MGHSERYSYTNRIFRIHLLETVDDEDLRRGVDQEPFASQFMRRNWNWIGHTLRKPTSNMTKKTLTSNLQGREREDLETLCSGFLR